MCLKLYSTEHVYNYILGSQCVKMCLQSGLYTVYDRYIIVLW